MGRARETWMGRSKPRGVHRVEVMESIPGDTQNSTEPAPSSPSWLSFEQGGWPEPPQLSANTSTPMDPTALTPSPSQPALPNVSKEQGRIYETRDAFWPDFVSLRDEGRDALDHGHGQKVQVAAQKRTPIFLLPLLFTRWQPSQVFVTFALLST